MTRKEKYGSLPKRVSVALKNAEFTSPSLFLSELGLKEIPEEVFTFKTLKYLDLSGNSLRTIPESLWNLPMLKEVKLVGNPIEFLPNRPGLIIDARTYLRCSAQVDPKNIELVVGLDITQEDAELWITKLRSGNLHSVSIGSLGFVPVNPTSGPTPALQMIIESLPALEGVESLSLRGFKLADMAESIFKIQGLKHLSLVALELQELPDCIGQMGLQTLRLTLNHLSTLPNSLKNLVDLTRLEIAANAFKKVPEVVFELTSLEELDMDDCNLSEIPADILRLPRLKALWIRGNPIDSPPKEVADKGLNAIRDYWRQRADTGVDYLCEAKLIILGEAGAGKTSLARKIQNPDYELQKDEKSTEGIDVIHYRFPTVLRTRENGQEKVIDRDFQVNIWDFGGQEIYHATHQFFLTRRSVYVLVCDDRKEDTDFSYWLQVVEMLSDASPLLIVQNEKQDRTRDINLSGLRAQFGNLRDAIATNLETNRGLDKVIRAIRKEIESLPHIGVGLPATWKRVREALEKDQRDYISLEEYLRICQDHGFTRREDKLQLSGYLHDLGICLHFQDDPLLKNIVVLKPSWGTDAVYRALDDTEVIANRGQFTRQHLARIWSAEKYAGMQDELLHLMMKFQLCYALETDQAYIAPQLLSSEQPSYPWESTGGFTIHYEYVFLPKGIITRFIVAMHRLIANVSLVWKTGVVLERDGTSAEVIEEYGQRTIRVRVSGTDPRGLLAIVDEQLERLHEKFPGLQYERHLPCPCIECKVDPYRFPLKKLFDMNLKSKKIQCYKSGEMIDANYVIGEILPTATVPFFIGGKKDRMSAMIHHVYSKEPSPEVFVSYAWTAESNAIVDRLQESLDRNGIRLSRDREEVRYKDSIREFMRRIGQGKAVVVVISEKYLKSENCMYEMVEIAKAQKFRERIFPIVLSDANIYKATGRIRYVNFWENEIRELDSALKTVRADNLTNLHEDLDLYSEIRRLFDGFADTLRDMNALTPDQHEGSGFEELIKRIQAQLGV